MPEKEPEFPPASGPRVAIPASDVRRRRSLPWKPIAAALGLALVVTLEILLLRFGPSISVGAETVVVIVLGFFFLAWLLAELFSWLSVWQSRAGMGRDKRP